MKDLEKIQSFKYLQNELNYFNQKNSSSHDFENVSIIIVNKKTFKNRIKHNVFMQAQQPRIACRLSRSSKHKKHSSITRQSSMPELTKYTRPITAGAPRNRNETKLNKYKKSPFQSQFTVNVVSEHRFDSKINPFCYPRQTKLKIYRCQLGAAQDSCCCSCNSDAMFEVMKGLYDCYKARNCDNCDCILCGHLKPEARKKSITALSEKERLQRAKDEGLLTPLAGKTPEQREKILIGLSMKGLPLPEGKTPSEKELIQKVRTELGLPKEPRDKTERDKHEQAAKGGKLWPLESKTPAEKEKILKDLQKMGIALPEGRTPSEKSLIAKLEAKSRASKATAKTLAPSEQIRRAKAEGLLTPLAGKTLEEKMNILKGLAMKGLPLPEGKTASEKKLINKVRTDLALPKEPINKAERDKHEKAAKAGKLLPLEGRTPAQKEKILKNLHNIGIPLPEGRTPSEKALIAKIAAGSRHPSKVTKVSLSPSEQMRRAKAEGLLTPLTGKTPEQKETILKGLSMKGLPLPEAKTPSEKKLIEKVRTDLGLPKEPKSKSERDKHERAARSGLLQPLEGKTPAQKEKILKGLHDLGIALPEGRTPSEKALIAKVAAKSRHPSKVSAVTMAPSEQMRRAKAEGLLTPLKGKTPEQKEKILNGLAMKGIPLPEGETPSEKKLIDKVRADLGLPKEPKNKAERAKHDQAAKAGLLQPLEGKTPAQKERILKGLHYLGIPLPVGRTPSEKALIAKVAASSRRPSKVSIVSLSPSEQMRKAKAEGLLTPLTGKTPEQKETILKGLSLKGLPLPEAKTPSEKKLIEKVRTDLGLPKEPKSKSERDKHERAARAGLLQPLEGKTPAQKEKILKGLHDLGIALPEGRTPSEKALIAKVAAKSRHPSKVSAVTMAPSEQMRRAKAEGLLTPLKGKTPEQKEKILNGLAMKGIPLPEGETPSEKKLIDKVRADLGLPKEPKNKAERAKHDQAAKAGLLQPLEGKTPAQKERILKGLHDLGIPLPVGRTPSEKALIAKVAASSRRPSKLSMVRLTPSEQMRKAKAGGLLTPLTGKTPEQKEKILEGLAKIGLPLPEGKTPSDKKLINKVRADLGLPKEPKNKVERDKHNKAAKAGLLQPLEGKTPAQKERILKGLHDLGIPLPVGRTPSEKALIAKVAASSRHPSKVSGVTVAPSEQLRRAIAAGLLTPLTGKTPEQKEKILEGLAMKGLPLPEGKTASEKKLIDKVRADLGLPKEPKNKAERDKQDKAAKAGLLQPLEGKTPAQKERILKGLHDLSIALPEGRTPSEKALIAKVAAKSRHPSKVSAVTMAPSDQMRRAIAEGLLTPLTGKTPEAKRKILEGLAKKGLALPEGKTASEKQLIDKVRADLGLPKEPKNKAERAKHDQAARAGLLQPLESKTPAQKEKILRGLHDLGIALPVGRTLSEKSLIAKVATRSRHPSKVSAVTMAPSEQMRRAKAEGLLTPLKGKTPEQQEKILKALANRGLPLPEGQTPSEKNVIKKVRADLGLPKEPKTKTDRVKLEKAALAGLLLPLEGKTPAQKEKILRGQHNMGIPLPEGRTPSEKSLIAKIAASSRHPSRVPSVAAAPSEQMRRAKAEGLLTPLMGKTPAQKENILKALANRGLPLPEGKSPSEKNLIDKVRADLGLPKEPKNDAEREKHEKAAKAGFLLPLEGKTPAQKEKILKGLHDMGIRLPEGRTPSEKSLIAKIAARSRRPSMLSTVIMAPSEQLRRAKEEGLLTPLTGKTPEQKEKILAGLAKKGLPLPEGKTASEKQLINKVRADLGLPKEPKSKAERDKQYKAAKAGLLQPLEGKTPAQKQKILKGLHDLGIQLPEGRTPSEKALIAKVAAKSRHPSRVTAVTMAPSEQLRRAKAEGLLTPLTGKTPEQKENILAGLAKKGLPLPEGKTDSEKQLINKLRADLGLPKEPKSKAERAKHDQAARAGLLQPLEGKTPAQKVKILEGLHDLGIALPEGRTASEKALIAKVAAKSRHPSRVSAVTLAPSEQLRRAKAEGLLSPLTGKTPDQKQKILERLAMRGLPLPEGKTPSEKKLIAKVRADLGLPKEPKNEAERDKHDLAAKDGLLKPLEGKTPEQKEKILKGLHDLGITLPEGRTPSEKALIAKVAASSRHPSKMTKVSLAPSEQMRRAKAEGLFTPLTGKTPEQKAKILKGLAMAGLPLPEGQTPSEKKLVDKVRADLGLPKEPKTKAERNKHEQAAKAGLLKPLEGKTNAQKKKILEGLHNLGIPLPEGRTPSEKALIAKIAATSRPPSIPPEETPSEKLRKAKLEGLEGLLTPLTGKTPEQKEKIVKGLAMAGLPLPDGQTPSEIKLIDKVRADVGLPPAPKTKAEKEKYEKAAKAGLLKPLADKTPEEKEAILKGLHDLGITLPEGRTASEKALIALITAAPRLSTVAASVTKKKTLAAGIEEELQEIVKTTTCDRACGCTKKKIRFKHSYVKIRVTSPDISSFCDCPGACFPGVKSGAFIDNDGIKVTVGRVIGIPSFAISQTNHSYAKYGHKILSVLQNNYSLTGSSSVESCCSRPCSAESENIYLQDSTYEGITSKSDRIVECLRRLQSFDDIYRGVTSETKSFSSSFDSVLVIKSEISLSSSNSTKSVDAISSMSIMKSSISSNCTRYSDDQSTDDPFSSSLLDGPVTSEDYIDHPETFGGRGTLRNIETVIPQREYTVSRISATKYNFGNNSRRINKSNSKTVEEPIILFKHLPNIFDVSKIMYKIMANKRFADASSIFIVVPESDDDEEQSFSDNLDSMTSIYASEISMTQQDTSHENPDLTLTRKSSFTKRNEQVCGKGKKFILKEISSSYDTETMSQNGSLKVLRCVDKTNDEIRQNRKPNVIAKMLEEAVHGIGTDTTADRPHFWRSKECCTPFVIQNCSSKDHYKANVISKQQMLLIRQDKPLSCWRLPDIRASSPVAQPSDSPSVVKSRLFTSKIGGCCLPDMRTPSPESLQGKVPTRLSIGPSQLPREMHDCSHISVMLAISSKSLDHLCRMPNCCDGQIHVPQLDPGQQPDRRRHSLNNPEPDSPSTHHHLCKKACTPCGLNPDFLKKETTVPRKSSIESLSHPETNEARPTSSTNKGSTKKSTTIKTNPSRPTDRPVDVSDSITYENLRGSKSHPSQRASSRSRPSSQQSKNQKQTSNDKYFECDEGTDTITDEICNRKSRPQTRWKSIMPKGSTSEEHNNVYEDPESAGIVRDNTSGRQTRLQTNLKSKMAKSYFSKGNNFESEDLKGADTITDVISNRQPRPQARRQSSLPNGYSTIKNHCLCENGADTTLDEILSQQPCFPERWQTKIPKDSSSEESCVCEDTEDSGIISSQTSSQQSKIPEEILSEEDIKGPDIVTDVMSDRQQYLQANRHLKMPKVSDSKEDREIPGPGLIIEETENQLSRSRASQQFLQEKPKIISLKSNCECQENPEDFTSQVDCECQKKSKDSDNKGFCVCQDLEESHTRCFITDPVRQNSNKITKFLSSVRKSISHKIDETSKTKGKKVKCKCLETSNIKGEKVICKCLDETSNIKGEKVICKCLDETSNIKGEKVTCKCFEETRNIKGEKVKCKCFEETSNIKGEKVICKCFEETRNIKREKIVCKCFEETSNIKGEKVKCKCFEETSKTKGEKVKCKCFEETSNIKGEKFICKCFEENVKCECYEKKNKEKPSKSKSQHSIQTTPEIGRDHNCGYMNIGKLIRLTSEFAECTSGFKACKKKKKLQTIEDQVQEIELDFEAAIKYYVGKNPEQFRDLLQPLELNQDKYQSRKGGAKIKKKKDKKAKDKSNKRDKTIGSVNLKDSQKHLKTPPKEPCECPYGPTPLYEACKLTPEACAELAKLYPKGIKFCLGGRGLAPVTKRAAGMADRDGVAGTAGLDGHA